MSYSGVRAKQNAGVISVFDIAKVHFVIQFLQVFIGFFVREYSCDVFNNVTSLCTLTNNRRSKMRNDIYPSATLLAEKLDKNAIIRVSESSKDQRNQLHFFKGRAIEVNGIVPHLLNDL
uniref:Uncharacterized protein n=1 Tax=Ascaris lumbricoides TaxID=6252 RepID=A0A0M3HRG8_ASCLU